MTPQRLNNAFWIAIKEDILPAARRLMQTFFHGWRRTTGVGTLVFASLVLAGWIRSLLIEQYVGDVAAFSLGGCRYVIATYPNQFAWWIWSEAETDHITLRTAILH